MKNGRTYKIYKNEPHKVYINVGGKQYPLTINQYNAFVERFYSGEYDKMKVSEFREMIEGIE